MRKWIFAMMLVVCCGCSHTSQKAQWGVESGVKTIVHPYRPEIVEKVELSLSLKKSW